jgi:Domain of unknown function (DUF4384)
VISAASPKQAAEPIVVNGKLRGALSYAFAVAQKNDLPSLQDLEQRLKSLISVWQREKKMDGDQVPQIEIISTVPLQAKPIFALQEPAQTTIIEAALANPQSKIKINLRTHQQKKSYKIGETISYDISSDAAGYLYLLVFSEGNVATCLYPNEQDKENKISSGTFTFPRTGYEFPIQEPVGRDVVVALVSQEKLNVGEKVEYKWEEIFARLNFKRFAEFIKSRDLNLVGAPPASVTDWQAATIVVETVK